MNHVFELIPLTIEAKGEVITNNIGEFREMVREALASLNLAPSTDEEFGQAELDAKALKDAEARVTDAKAKALADAEELNAMFVALDETSEEIRAARLGLEKAVAKRKEEVKAELIAEAIDKLECAPRLRQATYGRSVSDAIKGKRTLDSMRSALAVMVGIHNGAIAKNRKAIESFVKAHGEELVMDSQELEVKSPDNVEVELRRRFEAKKAAEERKRLEAEAAAARAAEAKAKADAAAAVAEVSKPAKCTLDIDPFPGKPTPPDLPKPPKIGSIPVGSQSAPPAGAIITQEQEWDCFCVLVREAFGPLKEARMNLKHSANQERAAAFATAVGTAWKEVTQ